MKSGPIIIIEDDVEDHDIFKEILRELNVTNKLVWFGNSIEALDFLRITPEQPFIIFCDVNMPKLNGIDLKRHIDGDPQLRRKSIPFVFFSTATDQKTIEDAYTQMTVQGFFKKKSSYTEVKKDIKIILDYWQLCQHPNTQ